MKSEHSWPLCAPPFEALLFLLVQILMSTLLMSQKFRARGKGETRLVFRFEVVMLHRCLMVISTVSP